MAREKDVKNKVVDLVGFARSKGKDIPHINVAGDIHGDLINAGQVTKIEGDVNINKKITGRRVIQPGPEHITPSQARKIKTIITDIVEMEAIRGGEKSKHFGAWYGKLYRKYDVNSYLLIPSHLGADAISWLQQQAAILRPKLRRADNKAWRKKHYNAIFARLRQLGRPKSYVYDLCAERLNKPIDSLTKLGERDLKKLYGIVMKLD